MRRCRPAWLALPFQLPLLLGLMLAATGCQPYATVRPKRPAHDATTPAGEMIAQALRRPQPPPLARLGKFLDAASSAAEVLRGEPNDARALLDYNFAVARVFGVLRDAGLEPWKAPLQCPGAHGIWSFSIDRDAHPEGDPSDFDIRPADTLGFRGTLVGERTVKAGLGAPLVVVGKDAASRGSQPFEARHIFYGMTGVIEFRGGECVARFHDPLCGRERRT